MIRREGREVTTLTIDVTASRNALGSAALGELAAGLTEAGADPAVRIVVITATGRVFSSGADRSELHEAAAMARIVDRLATVLTLIAELPQPVVCRVNGDAYGAGLAILAAADLALTVRRARFALPEVRFGLVPTLAAAVCVPRIGLTAALDLMLTGRTIGGAEAAALGLVAAAADDDVALDEMMSARLQELLAADPEALCHTKALIRQLTGQGLSAINTGVDQRDSAMG
jgi:enoyl-CoA hydratase/carnithine racemase